MAKIRLVQIVEGPEDSKLLKVLPGSFSNHREAQQSLTEDGEYVFLESHELKAAKKSEDGNEDKG